MKQVIIMRGPSGSGKGTWIRKNAPDAKVVSADHYFLVPCGMDVSDNAVRNEAGQLCEYRFEPHKLPLAHQHSYGEFLNAIGAGDECIVVDNTNTRLWEFSNYLLAAEMMGYNVRVIALRAITVEEIKLCASRNVHGVPIDVVAKMAYEYEKHDLDEVIPVSQSKAGEQ